MSDAREALVATVRGALLSNAGHRLPPEQVVADAILAAGWAPPTVKPLAAGPLIEHQPLPMVAHKGPHDTDASMFAAAADRLSQGYPLGGSNLTDAVVRLIRREIARGEES